MAKPAQIFMQFGLDASGLQGDSDTDHLVWIGDVERGRTKLVCPYCHISLVAKKGQQKQHHFAHETDSCRAVAVGAGIGIPLYDAFAALPGLFASDLRLLSQMLRLRQISRNAFRGSARFAFDRLVEEELLVEVPTGQRWVNNIGSHVYTDIGKQYALAGKHRLSLKAFDAVQQDAMLRQLHYLQVLAPMGGPSLIDLQLYQAHLKKLLAQQLYFLKIEANPGSKTVKSLYKIGITYRPIETRLREIHTDLSPHFDAVNIEIIGIWPGKGRLERYFKQTFHKYQHRLGSLTEYFDFDKKNGQYQKPFRELNQLKNVAMHETLSSL